VPLVVIADRKIIDFRACIGVPEGILGLIRQTVT
jgi:hypothetical protein